MFKLLSYKIPFDENGNLLHYPHRYDRMEWRENSEFNDTFTFTGFERGRSAAYFTLTNEKGKTAPMFLVDVSNAISHIVNGVLTGRFTYQKRGQNYGLRFMREREDE